MKLRPSISRRSAAAFSLAEFFLAMSLTLVVAGGVIYAHVMGQNLHNWSLAKVGASDQSRETLWRLQDEIRGAKNLRVGNYQSGLFSTPSLGTEHKGQALRIFATTNSSDYVQYRLHLFNSIYELRRTEWVDDTLVQQSERVVAEHLTNNPSMFALEDYSGNILTEPASTTIVAVTLDFQQFQYPLTKVGDDFYYDYYRLQTRIAKRTVE